MKRINLLVLFFISLVPLSSSAYSVTEEGTYVLGEGESRAVAREALIEKLKKRASDKAGSYIQTDKKLKNGDFKTSIKSISASIVKVLKKSESIKLKNDSIVLSIKATFDIDENVLKSRIKAMQEDENKAKLIKRLSKENESLHSRMKDLEQSLKNKALTTKELASVLTQKIRINSSINENNKAAQEVFTKGTLFAMIDETKRNRERLVETMGNDLTNFLRSANKKIKAKVINVSETGSHYNVSLRVNFPFGFTKKLYQKFSWSSNVYEKLGGNFENKTNFNKEVINKHLALLEVAEGQQNLVFQVGDVKRTLDFIFNVKSSGSFGRESRISVNKRSVKRTEKRLYSQQQPEYYSVSAFYFNMFENPKFDTGSNSAVITFELTEKEIKNADRVSVYFE